LAAAVLWMGSGAGGALATARAATAGGIQAATAGASQVTAAAAGPAQQEARLQKRLSADLGADGGQVGALVVDISTGQTLFAENPNLAAPPASLEKLYTSVAALNVLGEHARFDTDVYGVGKLAAGGVWDGNLYLRGGGDPTFGDGYWNRLYEDGHGPTAAQLATKLAARGIRRVTGHIYADESLFDTDRGGPATDNQPDVADYGGELSALVYDHGAAPGFWSPATFTAHEVALTLRSMGVHVSTTRRTETTPAGAVLLASVMSPPLSTLLRLMDVPSDDLIADMLDKQLGARVADQGTLAAGASVISRTIGADYGIHPTIFDGSGLDHADRSTPLQIVSLLRTLVGTPTGDVLQSALPIVGEQGTVQGIGVKTAAQGHCTAKTGTLNNVTNLAGYCSARAGDTLAFAIMLDGPSNYPALAELSRAVGAIAGF